MRRALAIVALVLGLPLASPVRADGGPPAVQTSGPRLPPPPPGTHRLIHIGPEVDVIQDEHGRLRMADEPPPKPRRGRGIVAVFIMLAAAGAVLTAGRNELTTGVGGRAPGPP